ncbi:caspase domain-containing protein [Russula vinacea]|nr:caspase domain-containing protein [Russula vinacea]
MVAIFSKPRQVPHFRRSADAPLPKYKALVIGINYTWSPDGSEPGNAALQLRGPVNDAKSIKEMLKDLYHYREQDIILMTDEEDNKGTVMWPSASNILQAIDKLVHGASRDDAFVFYYAGHCDRQMSSNDDNEVEHTYIIACDSNPILDDTLRKRLVEPLPIGSHLTAIMDACYSGPLLALDHYRCHGFLRQRRQTVSVRRKKQENISRRHTEAAGTLWVAHTTAFFRRRFASVVTTTLAIIRFKNRLSKRSKSKKRKQEEEEEEEEVSLPPTPTVVLVRCEICNRTHDLSNAPDVISLSPCTVDQRTWEDSTRKGKGMTVKLIKILRKNPRIKLGALNQQLNRCLSKLSFKRVKKATGAFRCLGELVPPERKEELGQRYKSLGLFDFWEQTAQFGSLRTLGLNDQFIFERDWPEDQSEPD